MKKNIFKYLRKKVLENSEFSQESKGEMIIYKIESLGFQDEVTYPNDFSASRFAKNILIDKMVEKAGFLEKLEQIENRKENLNTLLD